MQKRDNMTIIKIAEEQLKDVEEIALKNHEGFFNEYFTTLENREQFQKNIQSVLKTTDVELTESNINLLSKKLLSLIPLIKNIEENLIIPDFIFFIGLNNFDGHGLIIRGKPHTFFNMTPLNERLKNKSFVVSAQLLHEIFHAIHYFYSPAFYIKNYASIEHQYLKRIVAEGIATYFTFFAGNKKLNLNDSLWFGLIDNEHFTKWVENCEAKKASIGKTIEKVVASNNFDTTLADILFSVPGIEQEELTKGRFGYYYGLEIVKKAAEREGTKVLYLSYERFTDYILQYFKG